MKVFVAGAAGVIGRVLVPRLVRAGHDVAGMIRAAGKGEWLRSQGARPIVADVFDRQGLTAALRAERFDAIIDQLTSLGAGDYAANIRIRTEGTGNLLDAAAAAGIRRVVAQSFCMYASGDGVAQEGDALDLESGIYGGSIRGIVAMEDAVNGFGGVILRYGMLYGPGTWFARDGLIADQMRRGEFVATDDIASFLHIEDAAQAAVLALEWPAGTVNIVDDEPAPATEWAPVFADALGVAAPKVKAGGGSVERGVSNAKAKREFGWQPIHPSWREGFRRVLRSATASGGAPGSADA